MQPQSITVKVSAETAKAFSAAPASDKKIAEELLELLFRPKKKATLQEFKKLAEKANRDAVAKGLTEEELKSILDEG